MGNTDDHQPGDDNKAAKNRKDSMTKTNMKHKYKKGPQTKNRLGVISEKSLEGLNVFNSTDQIRNDIKSAKFSKPTFPHTSNPVNSVELMAG